MGLTRLAISRPLATLMFVIGLVIMGGIGYKLLKVDRLPNISFPFVSVSVSWPGASPEDIEEFIVKPIEATVSGVPGLASISSSSTSGRGSVSVQLVEGADATQVAIDIDRRVSGIRNRLPADASQPDVNRADPNSFPIMNIALSSPRSQEELYDLGVNTIQPKLQSVLGVANVQVSGGRQREVQIQVDVNKLTAYGVSFTQIQAAISRENVNTPAGTVVEGRSNVNIRAVGQFQSAAELGNVVISSVAGNTPVGQVSAGGGVRLNQVATIVETTKEATRFQRLNGVDAVGISIVKQSDANSLQVADDVKAAVESLKRSLPSDVRLIVTNDSSRFTRSSLDAVQNDLALAVLLVAAVLLLFLHSWRNVVIVILAIPTSLITTFVVMYALGFSLNTITLMALALAIGILVDDSIVVIENIHRHLKMGEPPLVAALNGRSEIGMAAIAITMVDVVVYLPIAFMSGNIGKLFREYGWTIAVATLLSLLVSFTLTPMLASRFLSSHRTGRRPHSLIEWLEYPFELFGQGFDKLWDRVAAMYGVLLRGALRVRPLVILAAVLALLGAFAMIQFGVVGREFAPTDDDNAMNVNIQLPTGTSLAAASQVLDQVDSILRSFPEVDQTFANVGGGGGFGGGGGSIQVQLIDKRLRSRSVFEVIEDARQKVRAVQGANVSFQVQNPLVGGGGGLRIQLLGDDYPTLQRLSQQVVQAVQGVDGVKDLRPPTIVGEPELRAVANRQRMADLGVSQQVIASTLRTAIAGSLVSALRPEGQLQRDITLIAQPSDRTDLTKLGGLPISTAGGFTRLNQVADLVRTNSPATISRQDRQRTLSISANVSGRPLGDVATDVRATVQSVSMPDGYRVVIGGSVQSLDTAFVSLMGALGLSILLIYMLMVALYEHWLHPLTIMFALPVALVGAIVALYLTGNTLNLFSMIGVIMLMGLVAKNGILLVDYTNTLRSRGKSRLEALLEAGPVRLKPIVMTSTTIVCAMIPLALKLESGAESRAPLAVVVIGGVISSTLLTLFVIPAVYTYLDSFGTFVLGTLFGRKPEPSMAVAAEAAEVGAGPAHEAEPAVAASSNGATAGRNRRWMLRR